jgi:hypothetical protein
VYQNRENLRKGKIESKRSFLLLLFLPPAAAAAAAAAAADHS